MCTKLQTKFELLHFRISRFFSWRVTHQSSGLFGQLPACGVRHKLILIVSGGKAPRDPRSIVTESLSWETLFVYSYVCPSSTLIPMVSFNVLAGGTGAFIISYLFTPDAGTLTVQGNFTTDQNPTWLALHPNNASIL